MVYLPKNALLRFNGIISDYIRYCSKYQGQEYCHFIAGRYNFTIKGKIQDVGRKSENVFFKDFLGSVEPFSL